MLMDEDIGPSGTETRCEVCGHEQNRVSEARDERPYVELYVHAGSSTGTNRGELIERLHRLEENGQIRQCSVFVHRRRQTDESSSLTQLLSRYDRFREWAERNGRELIGLGERTVRSVLTGTTNTRREFPPVLLAEYTDGDLQFVAPSCDGTTSTSVSERIDAYA